MSCLGLLHLCIVFMCAVLLLSLWAWEQTDGTTPLITASSEGQVEVVKALLVAGAEVNHAKV